jgi:hypothetical protein
LSTFFQTPRTAPAVVSLHKRPLPLIEFVDRDGDVWVATGHNPGGELLLACPQPSNPEDAGEGESFAWTLGLVQAQFGPLIARSAVAA